MRVFQDFDISGDGPIYRRLKAELARAVESGKLAHGEALPPERDLARIVGVSRVTVRRAIAELTSEGFLQRRHGAGTFVLRPPARIEQPLKRLTSFTEDMQARGLTPRSHWLECGLFSANAEEAEGLKLTENAAVARLSRIRLGDDLPMAIEHSTLPADILERPDLVETSLYGALAERGVTLGDIGPKIGYNTMDNGYAIFDHVRLPRAARAQGPEPDELPRAALRRSASRGDPQDRRPRLLQAEQEALRQDTGGHACRCRGRS